MIGTRAFNEIKAQRILGKTDIPKIRIVYNDHQLGLNRIKEIKAEIKQLSINFALAKRY